MNHAIDRPNAKNTGKQFEHEMQITIGGYQARRIATLRKVDPPTRVVGGGFARKVIFLPNPFPDYVGCWRDNGRALFIEAKSTLVPRLVFNTDSGGLNRTQWNNLKIWEAAGATIGLVWRYADAVVVFNWGALMAAEGRAAKSLKFDQGVPAKCGQGAVIYDFLAPLMSCE